MFFLGSHGSLQHIILINHSAHDKLTVKWRFWSDTWRDAPRTSVTGNDNAACPLPEVSLKSPSPPASPNEIQKLPSDMDPLSDTSSQAHRGSGGEHLQISKARKVLLFHAQEYSARVALLETELNERKKLLLNKFSGSRIRGGCGMLRRYARKDLRRR